MSHIINGNTSLHWFRVCAKLSLMHKDSRDRWFQNCRDYVREAKNKPCMDCRQSFPYYCMDFDHRDSAEKMGEVNELLGRVSIKRLIAEIEKCDVICSNCHRIRTHERMYSIEKLQEEVVKTRNRVLELGGVLNS